MLQGHSFSRPAPLVNIAATAVIVVSLTAIGAVTGLIPSAFSGRADAPVAYDAPAIAAVDGPVQLRSDGQLATTPAAPQCRHCGVIEAVRQVQIKGQATRLGTVAGGMNGSIVGSQFGRGSGRGAIDAPWGGFADPATEKNVSVTTSYRVVVRMEDGSARTVYQSAAPAFGVGEKVRVNNGVLVGRG